MHILLTSAHGWVGSHITPLLLEKGHSITGLARSSSTADKLTSLGVNPLQASLEQPAVIASYIRDNNVDAVIHTAFNHDFTKYAENSAMDLAVINAIGAALEGSGKPFITTSGMYGRTENDAAPADIPNPRARNEAAALAFADKGVKAMIIRLPPSVHGSGDVAFIPMLIKSAKEKGAAAYIEGKGVWSSVHVKDAAGLYVAALEKGQAGKRYHAVHNSGIAMEEIAETISQKVGVPKKAVSQDAAGQYVGFLAGFLAFDLGATSDQTKEELGWAPKEVGLLQDMREGTYFD